LTGAGFHAKLTAMFLPPLPLLSGALGAWLMLGLKIFAALGFMALANMVILYAC
jgi:hypothetical protein